jgi:DtxR family Mn-dependent transcriptional regulator
MTVASQKYLKAVYVLSKHGGSVRIADIAETLSVSKASVYSALKRLSDKGFVIHETYGDVELTRTGEKRAKALIESYKRLKQTLGAQNLPKKFEYLIGASGSLP